MPGWREGENYQGAVPQRDVAAWIFQADPGAYDVDGYLSRYTFNYWNCPRFADQMVIGMPVFFKRSGRGGGLVAHGWVAELPKPAAQVDRPEFLGLDLWIDEPRTDSPKVGIQLDDVRLTAEEGMMERKVLEAIPELAGHPLVTVRQGTVFRLSTEQAAGIYRVWAGHVQHVDAVVQGAVEGHRRLVIHYRIERNRRLIDDKKRDFRVKHGRLFCELCRFDYAQLYPVELIEGIIEAHHVRPLSELDGPCHTQMEDLMLVCSNCHALIHSTNDSEGNLRRLQQHFQ